jgi:hypothetical protein
LIELLLALLIFGAAIYFVSAPLRRGPDAPDREEGREAELADLEARKESKYREIRDTELDHAAGKLGEEDFRRQDAELRREAVEILDELDSRRRDEPG